MFRVGWTVQELGSRSILFQIALADAVAVIYVGLQNNLRGSLMACSVAEWLPSNQIKRIQYTHKINL